MASVHFLGLLIDGSHSFRFRPHILFVGVCQRNGDARGNVRSLFVKENLTCNYSVARKCIKLIAR